MASSSTTTAIQESPKSLTARAVSNAEFLHACGLGDVNTVRTRLQSTPSVRTRSGGVIQQGFLQAVYHNRYDVVELLLESGGKHVDVNQRHAHRWPWMARIWPNFTTTALIEACDNKIVNTQMIRLLLQHGANVTAEDAMGNNALASACVIGCLKPSYKSEVVQELLSAGSDPNSRCCFDSRPILTHLIGVFLAVHVQMVTWRLTANDRLMLSRYNAEVKSVIMTLIRNGAHVDVPDMQNDTALRVLLRARLGQHPGSAHCTEMLNAALPLPLTCLASQTIGRLGISYTFLPPIIRRQVALHERPVATCQTMTPNVQNNLNNILVMTFHALAGEPDTG